MLFLEGERVDGMLEGNELDGTVVLLMVGQALEG